MALLRGKHIISEVEGTRCTLVESGIDQKRADFLKDLLTGNGYTVKVEKEKAKDGTPLETYMVGTTDIFFNPVIRLYQKKLFRNDGKVINPAYWYQWPYSWDIPYWQVHR